MQNFRVLSKKTEDRTLLEAVPTGDSKGNVADRVKLEDGEDIFEAVERAESRKKKGIFNAKINIKIFDPIRTVVRIKAQPYKHLFELWFNSKNRATVVLRNIH